MPKEDEMWTHWDDWFEAAREAEARSEREAAQMYRDEGNRMYLIAAVQAFQNPCLPF
jgi:hypothetical protein